MRSRTASSRRAAELLLVVAVLVATHPVARAQEGVGLDRVADISRASSMSGLPLASAKIPPLRGVVSAADFGAKGDGTTDDTAAMQAAIAAVSGGGVVLIPAGTYAVSATLSVMNQRGVTLVGAGPWTAVLAPTAGVDGAPVLKFTNCRACGVSGLTIQGNPARPPSAAVESRVDAPAPGPAPSQLRLENLRLGSISTNSLVHGVRFTAARGSDQNNDLALLVNVEIDNFREAGISIEHSNSLLHRIVGGAIGNGPVAVRTTGGSFAMLGTGINVSDVDFDVRDGTQRHPNYVTNVMSESGSNILRTTTESGVVFHFVGYTKKGITPGGAVAIEFRSVRGALSMTDSELNLGQRNVLARFTDAESVARFTACNLGVTRLMWEGHLILLGNRWYPGAVTEMPGPRARLFQAGDSGAGFDPTQVRTLGSAFAAPTGKPQRTQGSVTIAGSATTTVVRFDGPQPDDRYRILLSSGVGVGSPRAGALRPHWVGKAADGFRINVETAPGEGNSVVIDWEIRR